MRIFCDFHHAGLAFSLRLLAKRLGYEIYFPIGTRWFDEGYWKIAEPYNNDPGTIAQYLQIKPEHKPSDNSPVLNNVIGRKPNWYEVEDVYHSDTFRSITFQQFLDTDIDVIVASIPDHWTTYKKLRDEYKPKAKVVAHMGNMFNEVHPCIIDGTIQNLMASTIPVKTPSSINAVFYHQEMPIVPYEPPTETMNISSYVHLLPKPEQYQSYKSRLPVFNWKAYGASSPDGWQPTLKKLYQSMQNDMFVYHVKPRGDGFGWNWHSAFMLGRPILTNFSDYKDKLGGKLFEDGVTGLDFESHTPLENQEALLQWFSSGFYIEASYNAYERFRDLIDYDVESKKIKKFLENLK